MTPMETRLRTLSLLAPLDLALANLLVRLERPAHQDTLFLLATLVSHATFTQRHIYLRLDEITQINSLFPELDELQHNALAALIAETSFEALSDMECIGSVSAPEKPLILEDGRLYLQRFWQVENRLRDFLLARLADPVETPPDIPAICALHPHLADPDNLQVAAVRNVFRHRFSVICGGPGTGKTTVAAAILAQALANDPKIVAVVCAPTGKAQARLAEALLEESAKLQTDTAIRDAVRDIGASTLHRLLGRGGRVDADLIIVDEISMVPSEMFCRLVNSLKPGARLVLLGDKDQLAAVENGTLLADLCTVAKRDPRWMGRITLLTRSHRFSAEGGIGQLKDRVNAGDAKGVRQLLATPSNELTFKSPSPDGRILDFMESAIRAETAFKAGPWLTRYADIKDAFAAMDDFKILCAQRGGIVGENTVNLLVRRILKRPAGYFDGLPIMILENDYNLQLFNGDIGLCREVDGHIMVCFPDATHGLREIAPVLLPVHSDAFAMTIHKSQGSGFGNVLLILPFASSPLLSRELLYTGITRAKRHLTICGTPRALETATRQATIRHSALPVKLLEKD